MADIKVDYIVDKTQLVEAVELLESVGGITKENADKFRALNAEFAKTQPILAGTTSAVNSTGDALSQLTNSINNIQPAIISAFAKDKVEGLNNSLVKNKEVLDAAAGSINAMQQQYDKLKIAYRAATDPTQLEEMKGQLQALDSQIKIATGRFDESGKRMRVGNQELLLQFSQIGQAIAGAFQLANLTGFIKNQKISEDVSKAFNAILALNSLIIVYNTQVTQENSLARTLGTKITAAWGVVVGVVTGEISLATVATAAWAAALNLIPFVAIATLLGVLIEQVDTYTSNEKDATAATDELTKSLKSQYQADNDTLKNMKQVSDEEKKILDNKLALAKAQGASLSELETKRKLYQKVEIDDAQQTQAKLTGIINKGRDDLAANEKLLQAALSKDPLGEKKATQKLQIQYDLISKQLAANKDYYNELGIFVTETNDAEATKQAEFNQKIIEQRDKDNKAYLDGKLLLDKNNAEKEFNDKKQELAAIRTEELDKLSLTNADKYLIEQKYINDIKELNEAYKAKQLNNEASYAKAVANISIQGSKEQLDASIKALELERDAKLTSTLLTENARFEIEAQTDKAIQTLRIANINTTASIESDKFNTLNNIKLSEGLITEKQFNDTKLDIERQTNEKEITLFKAQNLTNTVEYDKLIQKKSEIDLEYREKNFNDEIRALKKNLNEQEIIINNSGKSKPVIRENTNEAELKNLQDTKATYIKFGKDITDINKQIADKQRQIIEESAQLQRDKIIKAIDDTKKAGDLLFSSLDAHYKNDEDNLQAQLQRKQISEQAYHAQIAALHRKEAEAKKQEALFNATVETAVNIIKAVGSAPFPANVPAIVEASVTGAVEIGIIAAQKIPSYAKGKERIDGPGTATSDSIQANLSVGERVISADVNEQYFPILSAIHNRKIEPDFLNAIAASHPLYDIITTQPEKTDRQLDYEELAKHMAKHVGKEIGKLPLQSFTIDAKGLRRYVKQGDSMTEYINQRYTS